MSGHKSLGKALVILDARAQALELMLADEMKMKVALRAKQVAITDQENDLLASLQEHAATDPASFRFRELRLRKLADDQRRLQPVLAKAAIQRQKVQIALKSILRKRLGLTLQLEKLDAHAPVFHSEEERAHVLFEISKRR